MSYPHLESIFELCFDIWLLDYLQSTHTARLRDLTFILPMRISQNNFLLLTEL